MAEQPNEYVASDGQRHEGFPPPGYWLAADGRWYAPGQAGPPAAPPPGDVQSGPSAAGPSASGSPRRRPWIIAAGAWQAGAWIAFVVGIVTTSAQLIFYALLALLPLYFIWRFRYWRARRTPEPKIMRRPPRNAPFNSDHLMTAMTAGYDRDGDFDADTKRRFAMADAKAERPTVYTRYVQRSFNRGCGGMLVGLFFPIIDAVRELAGRPSV